MIAQSLPGWSAINQKRRNLIAVRFELQLRSTCPEPKCSNAFEAYPSDRLIQEKPSYCARSVRSLRCTLWTYWNRSQDQGKECTKEFPSIKPSYSRFLIKRPVHWTAFNRPTALIDIFLILNFICKFLSGSHWVHLIKKTTCKVFLVYKSKDFKWTALISWARAAGFADQMSLDSRAPIFLQSALLNKAFIRINKDAIGSDEYRRLVGVPNLFI